MRSVIVRTNLDDEVDYRGKSDRRRASVRFVATPAADAPREPMLGDPWEPLTVRARLHRLNWVLTKDPRVGPRKDPRSCCPEPVREIFKDQPGEPMRIPVPRADHDAVNATLQSLLRFKDESDRAVIFAIAARSSARDLGEALRCHHATAARRIEEMLKLLAGHWNNLRLAPDQVDIDRAIRLIHRDFK